LVLFPLIQEHEDWCRKDKCANKQCQAILEYRSRKEFKFKDKTIQVCDNVCYEMFRLQNALKPVPLGSVDESQFFVASEQKEKDWAVIQKRNNYLKTLTFFHEYFME